MMGDRKAFATREHTTVYRATVYADAEGDMATNPDSGERFGCDPLPGHPSRGAIHVTTDDPRTIYDMLGRAAVVSIERIGIVYASAPAIPLLTPREHDRERCEARWNAAGGWIQECHERRDKAGAEDAALDQQNYAIALDIHRGAGRENAIGELRRRYDVLAGYLMIYGGTDFVNACRSAIVEERWCDLVESIAALEHEYVRSGRLRWGKDADGNRIAVEIEPGHYHIPANLYPGHPFDAKKEQ